MSYMDKLLALHAVAMILLMLGFIAALGFLTLLVTWGEEDDFEETL